MEDGKKTNTRNTPLDGPINTNDDLLDSGKQTNDNRYKSTGEGLFKNIGKKKKVTPE
jgi:hypothetical protein